MKKYKVSDISGVLSNSCLVKGNSENAYFTNAKPILECNNESIAWIAKGRNDAEKLLKETSAPIIVCDSEVLTKDYESSKCFIIVENPRLSFLRVISLLEQKPQPGIHPTAFIHPEARLGSDIYIGPFVYVGNSSIDDNTIIHGHVYIYDNVKIGKNVIVHAGTVIGSDGFGYSRNEKNEFEKFPHVGGVEIHNYVEIGANSCIDRGTLGNTIIKEGAKIDNLVHIAHNVQVGRHSAVIANAMIGGSTKIGNNSWISPSAILRDTISVGNDTTIGMGALVTKDVPDHETWAGSPAKPLKEFLELQKKLRNL
ncbi:MAG: UDP-3-O-(3-hydroxymyristoyl)glucosamine N-acyltransferase [Bacteroidota bacterium]